MKKLIALMMVLILSLSLTACGEEEAKLESQTVNGLTFDVPDDFGAFEDSDGNIKIAKNEDSTGVITLSERQDAEGTAASDWDEATFTEYILSSFEDLKVIEFSNSKSIAGAKAVYAHYSGKNSSDVEVEGYNYLIYFEDGTFQSIAFSLTKDADTSLSKNLTKIIDSIK